MSSLPQSTAHNATDVHRSPPSLLINELHISPKMPTSSAKNAHRPRPTAKHRPTSKSPVSPESASRDPQTPPAPKKQKKPKKGAPYWVVINYQMSKIYRMQSFAQIWKCKYLQNTKCRYLQNCICAHKMCAHAKQYTSCRNSNLITKNAFGAARYVWFSGFVYNRYQCSITNTWSNELMRVWFSDLWGAMLW